MAIKQQRPGTEVKAHAAWMRIVAALTDVTGAPHDPALRATLARHWAAIAVLRPGKKFKFDELVPGFALRPDFDRQDCGVTARVLPQLDALIAAEVDLGSLLPSRASLRFGWRSFDAAFDDLERARSLLTAGSRAATALDERIADYRRYYDKQPVITPGIDRHYTAWGRKLGARAANTVRFAPIPYEVVSELAIASELDGRLIAANEAMLAAGFERLGWVDHLELSAAGEQRALTGVWSDGEVIVDAFAFGAADGVDVVTRLSDDTLLITDSGRARNHFQGVPGVDVLHVDASESMLDLIAIHRARVGVHLADDPGVSARPSAALEDWLEAEELARVAKLTFRLAHGMSEAEARGFHVGAAEVVVPAMRAGACAAVQAARPDGWTPAPARPATG